MLKKVTNVGKKLKKCGEKNYKYFKNHRKKLQKHHKGVKVDQNVKNKFEFKMSTEKNKNLAWSTGRQPKG